MTTRQVSLSTLLAALLILGAGCATVPHPDRYRLQGLQQQMSVRYGVVLAVRKVYVELPASGTGGNIGAAVGASVGSGITPSRLGLGAAVAAGSLGQLLGQEAERRLATAEALEIHYRDESSEQEFVLVQAEDAANPIRVGDRIRIVIGPESIRATRLPPVAAQSLDKPSEPHRKPGQP